MLFVSRLTNLTLMMTSAKVVETSVTVTDNSPFQDYPHPDDHTTQSTTTTTTTTSTTTTTTTTSTTSEDVC